ncbi:uncharacterized protein LOC131680665 [Topomyia yanbarensis]|uniref:uncharacterized protein LOC131680665 n=1 Tax=Topomyia yanbarensis TaxID=2498891 RepID=UPI00273C1CA3|nr:uncharacterized protein LOC131680665 [Topomyia yanbarensis]XP_058817369.1 uncharacterized protein LOC131680665 [Topomyia yanbarensis]XP_058817375.1 uncharacterized protein LOC131680665 [Topomyia yanbarensis]
MHSTNFTPSDAIFVSLWFWIEIHLLAIAILLSLSSLFVERMSPRKAPLHKRTVLITNGTASLSQALCEELIEKYDCRVVLVSGSNQETIRQHGSLQMFYCDLSNRQQVTDLAIIIEKEFDHIDIVIHQDSSVGVGRTPQQAEHFVCQSSSDILGFVNILTNFVPAMLHHGGGKIVSIRKTLQSTKALLDSESQYHDLVKSISLSTQTASISGPESIQLSTIFCDLLHQQQQHPPPPAGTKLTFNLNLTDRELAQRILRGIESEQSIVQVSVRRSLLELCSNNIAQLAAFGLDKLRKAPKIPTKVR